MTSDWARSLKRFWLPVAALLAVHAALGIGTAARLTATHDEYWHLPVGLLSWKTGRFHFDNLNPPLCRMAAALPLVFTSAQTGPIDAQHDAMGWGDAFVAANRTHYDRWFFVGRTMIVVCSVLGGLATACWARELFGDGAGCLAALLWAFEPNLIAHGSLVTTDAGAAAFFVFTLYALWKFVRRPGWRLAVLFGVVLGLAQLVKFTALILYPISLIALVPMALSDREVQTGISRKIPWARVFGLWFIACLLSVAVLNAGYLFRGSFAPLRGYDFQSHALGTFADHFRSFGGFPVPLPRDYVEGIDHQRQVMEQKHPVFLDGEWSEGGFPRYYLWALFYKLPHALQILAITSLLWIALPHGVSRCPWTQAFLLVPAVTMIAVAESSSMQLGVRYVLPALPFLIVFASQSAQWFDFKMFPVRALTIVVLTGWMALSVRYHPDHLAYFNELAGGPLGGREHLLDSNLDWGQDLGGLKAYLDGQVGAPKDDEIGLAYFGTVPPSSLGIRYHIPPSRVPQPGRYAVSVNFEQGRPHWVRTPQGEIRPVDIAEFAYFSFFKPTAHIGYSIDVFDLTQRDVDAWRSAAAEALRR
jgi:hypothetical protein